MREDKSEEGHCGPKPAAFDEEDVEDISLLSEVGGCAGGRVVGLVGWVVEGTRCCDVRCQH